MHDLEEARVKLNSMIIGVNIIFAVILHLMLTHQMLIAGNMDLVAVGLFFIPLATIAVAVTPLVR